jgi:hypothetical protein
MKREIIYKLGIHKKNKSISKGNFYITRWLYNFKVHGGTRIGRFILLLSLRVLLLISILLDVTIWLLKVTWELLKVAFLFAFKKLNSLVDKLLSSLVKIFTLVVTRIVVWVTPILVILLFYTLFTTGQWENLKNILESFWEYLLSFK